MVKIGDWNDYVIRAEGKRIQLWLNGVQTVDYTEEDPTVDTAGVIAVQIHAGPPTEAWYKDITLLDLAKIASERASRMFGERASHAALRLHGA